MTAFGSDVVITAVKELHKPEQKPQIYATAKTQKLLREKPAAMTSSSRIGNNSDPWLDKDPWGGYKPSGSTPAKVSQTHRADLQEQIRKDVQTAMDQLNKKDDMMDDQDPIYTTETEQRFMALETGLVNFSSRMGSFCNGFSKLVKDSNRMRRS